MPKRIRERVVSFVGHLLTINTAEGAFEFDNPIALDHATSPSDLNPETEYFWVRIRYGNNESYVIRCEDEFEQQIIIQEFLDFEI